MKRRKTPPTDSLEMLLDTISNTFGGILFLTILVAILVQFSGTKARKAQSENPTTKTITELRDTLAQKTDQLQSLKRALNTQNHTLADFKPDQNKAIIHKILSLRTSKRELERQRVELATQVSKLENVNAELDDQLQQTGSHLKQARQDEKRLQEQLQAEMQKRTRMARLPALRATQKREFAAILRYGRLYFPYATEQAKLLKSLNYHDFVVLAEDRSTIRITPKPYAGLVIDASNNLDAVLGKRLAGLDRDTLYLAVAVWEDSFADFMYLRNSLVQLGWEYRLIPLKENGVIVESNVGNPKVQ